MYATDKLSQGAILHKLLCGPSVPESNTAISTPNIPNHLGYTSRAALFGDSPSGSAFLEGLTACVCVCMCVLYPSNLNAWMNMSVSHESNASHSICCQSVFSLVF